MLRFTAFDERKKPQNLFWHIHTTYHVLGQRSKTGGREKERDFSVCRGCMRRNIILLLWAEELMYQSICEDIYSTFTIHFLSKPLSPWLTPAPPQLIIRAGDKGRPRLVSSSFSRPLPWRRKEGKSLCRRFFSFSSKTKFSSLSSFERIFLIY